MKFISEGNSYANTSRPLSDLLYSRIFYEIVNNVLFPLLRSSLLNTGRACRLLTPPLALPLRGGPFSDELILILDS